MPAKAPPVGDRLAAGLRALGGRIRAQREQQKVSATAAAEAAGMSRVTLHRIERGEPSVTMGAYLSALAAVGLELAVTDRQRARGVAAGKGAAALIRLDDYPQLKGLAWQRQGVGEISPAEALSLYERNWRHIDQAGLQPAERALVQRLAATLGSGRLLV